MRDRRIANLRRFDCEGSRSEREGKALMIGTNTLKQRFVERARKDSGLANKLQAMAKLEAQAMPGIQSGGMTAGSIDDMLAHSQSRSGVSQAGRLMALYKEAAQMIAEVGDPVDEISDWISYHHQDVLRELGDRKPWWKIF